MHTETFSVDRELVVALAEALAEDRNILAVGTTSVRTIESLPYIGLHLLQSAADFNVTQWEAYETPADTDLRRETVRALRAIVDYMDARGVKSLTASTSIMIAPGFRWRIVDMMVTNFHQPQSTLLLLVSSFLGDDAGNGDRVGDGCTARRSAMVTDSFHTVTPVCSKEIEYGYRNNTSGLEEHCRTGHYT